MMAFYYSFQYSESISAMNEGNVSDVFHVSMNGNTATFGCI